MLLDGRESRGSTKQPLCRAGMWPTPTARRDVRDAVGRQQRPEQRIACSDLEHRQSGTGCAARTRHHDRVNSAEAICRRWCPRDRGLWQSARKRAAATVQRLPGRRRTANVNGPSTPCEHQRDHGGARRSCQPSLVERRTRGDDPEIRRRVARGGGARYAACCRGTAPLHSGHGPDRCRVGEEPFLARACPTYGRCGAGGVDGRTEQEARRAGGGQRPTRRVLRGVS